MASSIVRILTIIMLGIAYAIIIGFTISGDLPVLLAIGVFAAVSIVGICGIYESSTTVDQRD